MTDKPLESLMPPSRRISPLPKAAECASKRKSTLNTVNSSRTSGMTWARQMSRGTSNHEKIVENYEQNLSAFTESTEFSNDADPINIICMDGGAMKGYSHAAIWSELQNMTGSGDFVEYFDMACGTSVGGQAALMAGHNGTTAGLLKDAKTLLDRVRKKSIKNASLWNLLCGGAMSKGREKIAHILSDYYNDAPLYNPSGLKTFALCTVRHQQDDGTSTFDPFVLRSYDLPEEFDERAGIEFEGTSDILLWEAMAATSAAPILFDRVELSVNGEVKRCGDGLIVSNSPLVVALSEARRIWPRRPLGIIVSLGCGTRDDELLLRTINAAKKENPDLMYLRLVPPMDDFSVIETDDLVLEKLKQVAIDYTKSKAKEVLPVITRLKASGSRNAARAKPTGRQSRMSGWGKAVFGRKSIMPDWMTGRKSMFPGTGGRKSMFPGLGANPRKSVFPGFGTGASTRNLLGGRKSVFPGTSPRNLMRDGRKSLAAANRVMTISGATLATIDIQQEELGDYWRGAVQDEGVLLSVDEEEEQTGDVFIDDDDWDEDGKFDLHRSR
jgi:predicted acylesterase/phospholipase RssA